MSASVRSPYHCPLPNSARYGLSVVESLVAMAVLTIAGAALISSLGAASRTARDLALMSVARGLAEQRLVEVVSLPVPPGLPSATPIGNSTQFTQIDHYHSYSTVPVLTTVGNPVGTILGLPPVALRPDQTLLSGFQQTVTVERVLPSGSGWAATTSATTAYRRVRVVVTYQQAGRSRPLAELSQIVARLEPAL